jgi:hypothetical protein
MMKPVFDFFALVDSLLVLDFSWRRIGLFERLLILRGFETIVLSEPEGTVPEPMPSWPRLLSPHP